MNLKEAKQWAEYNAYIVSNTNWFVISWNDNYIVIDQKTYDRHPEKWEKRGIKYKIGYNSLSEKKLKQLRKKYIKLFE